MYYWCARRPRSSSPSGRRPVSQYGATAANGDEQDIADLLVQAVVAPQSDLIGRTIG
jgi:hypothetical protein